MRWDRIVAGEPVPAGATELGARLSKVGEHHLAVTLTVDGRTVGRGEVRRFTPIRFNLVGAGLTVGADRGLEVCDDYRAPFPFTGVVQHVEIEVEGEAYADPKASAEIAVARQ
jgi:arylsulfatase